MARDLTARASNPALVVSADDLLRDAHLALLRAAGWSAIGAATCEEGLRIVTRLRVGVVLFDIAGGADWYQCRRLRAALHRTPIIVLSGTCTPDRWYRGVAQRIGCAGFVMKACEPREVLEAVQRTCAGESWVEYVPAHAT